MSDHLSLHSDGPAVRAGPVVYRNVKAYWETTMREGFYLPAFSSKFVNEHTITAMKNGQILAIRQTQVTFRVCMTPPTKLVLINKYEQLVRRHQTKSGIDMEKQNFPDKEWLILAIATLSGGADPIFDANYVPNSDIFGQPKPQQMQMNTDIPQHLLGFGKGRHLKLGGITKEEKVAHQLKVSEARVQKQSEKQERLKKELELHKAKDKQAVQKLQEREKVKSEVVAEYQAQANNYVSEEIAKAKLQMQLDFDRRMHEAALQQQLNQSFQPVFPKLSMPMMQSKSGLQIPAHQDFLGEFEDMEVSNDASLMSVQSQAVSSTKLATQQRKRNQAAKTNVISNQEDF